MFHGLRLVTERNDFRLYFSYLFQFFPNVFHFFLLLFLDQLHFFLSIIEFDMRVHIEGDGYIAVTHQVLESFSTDSRQSHIGTVRMPADVRCNFG